MGLNIPVGEKAPDEIKVHVEIKKGSNVKYEVDENGILFLDRIVHTPMMYPLDYGYIPSTLGADGDPVDVMVVLPDAIEAGCVIKCRPIGVLMMEDESGMDEKIIAVPVTKLTPMYKDVQELSDLPEHLMERITHFFEHYKDLEEGKWVKLSGTGDAAKAKELIQEGIERAQ